MLALGSHSYLQTQRSLLKSAYLTAQGFPPVLQHRESMAGCLDYHFRIVPSEELLEHHGPFSAFYAVARESCRKLALVVAEQALDSATSPQASRCASAEMGTLLCSLFL